MHCYVIQSSMLAMFLPSKASVSVLTSPVLAINTFIQHVCMYVYHEIVKKSYRTTSKNYIKEIFY